MEIQERSETTYTENGILKTLLEYWEYLVPLNLQWKPQLAGILNKKHNNNNNNNNNSNKDIYFQFFSIIGLWSLYQHFSFW